MLNDRTRLLFPASGEAKLGLLFAPQVLRCVAAGPGGHPLTVLLDTGTDPSAIDLGLARRLGLPLGAFALGSDAASDSVPFAETVLPWLRLGDLELRDLYVHAIDLSGAPFKVDLVLGYNVLANLTLTVGYAAGLLHLRHPDIAPPPPGPAGHSLPLGFADHFPALAGLWVAHPTAGGGDLDLPLATIDTGSNSGLTISPDLAAQMGLHRDDARISAGRGRGFASATEVLLGATVDLRVGPFRLPEVDLDAPAGGPGELGRAGRVNIGNRLLSRFARVTLDYRRGLCVLDP